MGITFDSVLAAVVSAGLMMLLLQVLMIKPQWLHSRNPQLLTYIVQLIFFAMMFPFHYLNIQTRPSYLEVWFARYASRLWVGPLTGYAMLQYVWLAGALVMLARYIREECYVRNVISILEGEGKFFCVQDLMLDYAGPDYPVCVTSLFKTPMVISQNHMIVIPDTSYTSREMDFILRHELEHLFNRDGIYLKMYNLLKIIYWWCPLIYMFRETFVLFCEIRVDCGVTRWSSPEECMDYCQSMITVSRKSRTIPSLAGSFAFALTRDDMFSLRVKYLIHLFSTPFASSQTSSLYAGALMAGMVMIAAVLA